MIRTNYSGADLALAEVLKFWSSSYRCSLLFPQCFPGPQLFSLDKWTRWAPGSTNTFLFLGQKQSRCQSFPHNNIYVWSPLAWKVWCNYIWNIGEPPPWRGLKKELTAWAWQLVDNLQPPDCVSNGTVRRAAVKTVSQGKRGHCNQTRASGSQRQHIKYEWSADQPANVFVHK